MESDRGWEWSYPGVILYVIGGRAIFTITLIVPPKDAMDWEVRI